MDYEVIKDTQQALEILESYTTTDPTFCDTETDGLYGPVRLLQLYQPATNDMIYLFDFDNVDYEAITQTDLLLGLWTVWHNASYDFGTMNLTTDQFDDTLWLCRLKYPAWKSFGLDYAVEKLVGPDLYEGLDKKKLQKASFIMGAYLSKDQLRYAATDVKALSMIWDSVEKMRDIFAYKVDILSLKYSIQYQQNRILVDQEAVTKELKLVEEKLTIEYEKLNGINSKSTPQVKAEFLRLTGVEPETTAKSYLIRQITEQGPSADFAQVVFDNRRSRLRETNLHKYNQPWLITKFNPNGAATGRFSSNGGKDGSLPNSINAQNITRDLQYIMNQDTEDTIVVHADYSTAELRAGCSIMQDAGMYKELMAGKDLHKISAMLADPLLTYDNVTKEQRQKGKAISFGFIFGMSAHGFVDYAYENYGVKFTLEEAKKVKKAHQNNYPNIARYASNKWDTYKTKPNSTPQGHMAMAKLGTDAINHATQGCIAETVKLAIHYMVQENPDTLDYLYNVVHDAIYLRVPKGDEKLWADLLTNNMIKAWKETCKLPMMFYKDIPMPVEVEYNDSVTNEYVCKEVQ